MMMALKEANESDYWIELLYASSLITYKMHVSLKEDMVELLKILVASTKTVKGKMEWKVATPYSLILTTLKGRLCLTNIR